MHSIERYGIVALLFLVVTVVAVLMWDGGKNKRKEELASSLRPASPEAPAARTEEEHAGRRLSLLAESRPGPLVRPRTATEPEALDEGAEPEALPAEPEPASLEPLPGDAALSAGSGEPAVRPATQSRREEPAPEQVVGSKAGAMRDYRVGSGDTLSEIAQRELGSSRRWQEIVAANPGLDPARLQAGRTIRIPGAAAAGAPPARPAEASSPAAPLKPVAAKGGTWKVGAGESLWKIAAQALGDGKRWKEIAALNPGVDPDRLKAGQVLVLPAGSASRSTPSAVPASAPRPKKASAPVVADRVAPSSQARRGGKVK